MWLWVHTSDSRIGDAGGFLDVRPDSLALDLIAIGKAQLPHDTPLLAVVEPIVEQWKGLQAVFISTGPSNISAPVVTGTPTVGQVLTCTAGTWQGTPTITYLWFVDGVSTGVTTNTYTVTGGNVALGSFIYCQVTATDSNGFTYANSNVLTTAILPVNTGAPIISGSTVPGATLTSTSGSWTGSPTPVLTYQWNAGGVAIPGATANTYVIAAQGTSYTCTVTGTNNAGYWSATSNAIVSQTAPANTTAPTVTGDATVGNVLTSTQGTWTGSPTIIYGYQWLKNGSEISGQVSTTYTSVTGDIGATIACRVTGTNATGASSATSNGLVITAAVIAPPANTVLPAVTGNAQVGSLLSCTQGTWTGQAPITYVYQWKADTVNIAGATNATYTTLAGDVGKTITCRVTASNVGGVTIATSNGIVVTNVPAFTPASLFAAGEQGAWYDPSDFSTMFQGSAGTTPVTAVGQSVGLILDKSKGLVLGPELVTNGDFSNGTTGWVGSNASLSVVSGALRATNTSSYGYAKPSSVITTIAGVWYKVTFTSILVNTFSVTFRAGSYPDAEDLANKFVFTTTGEKTYYFRAISTTTYLTFQLNTGIGDTFDVDNVTCVSIAGNHAIQATAAARPVLRQDANSKYYLEFDGVDDTMQAASINLSSIKQVTAFTGDSIQSVAGWLQVFQFAISVNTVGAFGLYMPFGGTNASMFAWPSSASANQSALWTNSGIGVKEVLAISLNNPAATRQIVARKNAVEVAALNGTGYDSGFSNDNFNIGSNGGPGEFSPCRIYSLILRGAASTPTEITDTETWVNGKTGAY